jgi:hypothetical protein
VFEAAGAVRAQTGEPVAASARRPQEAPLKVQLVLTKLQGEKEVSRTPYTLSLTGEGNGQLRLGTQIPLPTTTTTASADGKPATTTQSVQYKDIGTSIDCYSRINSDGSFKLIINISDSTVYAPAGGPSATIVSSAPPTIRSFSSSNIVVLKDGGTDQFIVAVDKQTGEILRASVTLNVQK